MLAAVIVMLYVPGGVTAPEPPPGPGATEAGILRPAPHPFATTSTHNVSAARTLLRRNAKKHTGTVRKAKTTPLPANGDSSRALVVPVRIVTETVAVFPSIASDAGVILQLEFCGTPVQVSATVAPATAGPDV